MRKNESCEVPAGPFRKEEGWGSESLRNLLGAFAERFSVQLKYYSSPLCPWLVGSSLCALKRFGGLLSGLAGKETGVAVRCPLGWGYPGGALEGVFQSFCSVLVREKRCFQGHRCPGIDLAVLFSS